MEKLLRARLGHIRMASPCRLVQKPVELDGAPLPRRIRESRSCGCGPSCFTFSTVFVSGVVLVPIAMFLICAFFAAILWVLECTDVNEPFGADDVPQGVCSFYEWWKYIVGNLVGVSGLTTIGPRSGHVFAEIVDLFIAVWSLTVCGLVFGMIGNSVRASTVTEGASSIISSHLQRSFSDEARAKASASGLGLAEFTRLCQENEISLGPKRLHDLFHAADETRSGELDLTEVEKLLSKLKIVTDGSSAEVVARVDGIEAKLDKMMSVLEAVQSRVGPEPG